MTILAKYIRRFVLVRPSELVPVGWSFAWFFFVLAAYYMLRPIRETMATVVGSEFLNWLFLAVFVTMLLAAPLFSWTVSRFSRHRLVPVVFRFFAAWLLGFSLLVGRMEEPSFWIGCVFYVWLSVFNLFVVSLFWSVLADLFSSEQGKRLFGFIAAAGSLGGLAASLIVGTWADFLGLQLLLLLPFVVLEAGLFCYQRLEKSSAQLAKARCDDRSDIVAGAIVAGATGGSMWNGVVCIVRSPYLLAVCGFLLLGKFCATVIYLQLVGLVESEVAVVEHRTELFARENAAVQVLTLICQLFLAGLLMRRLGLAVTLSLVPITLALGFVALAFEPSLWTAFVIQILQRSGAYGLLNPAREVLFTVVSREEKYTSKNFIDTAIFRGGDTAAAQIQRLLTALVGSSGIALITLPCAVMWAVLGWMLGVRQRQLERQQDADQRRN